MKITSVILEGVGKFGTLTEIAGLGAGVNVLAAGNEAGKSTMFRAIRACLFERHNTKNEVVRNLATDGVSLPITVTLGFDHADQAYRVTKSFVKSPAASLMRDGKEIARGREARRDRLGTARYCAWQRTIGRRSRLRPLMGRARAIDARSHAFGVRAGVASGLDELEQLTREIQDSVMAIRAQPVKSVFQRMPRLVREVAAMTGKPVRLVTEGENTEVDKTVIERLADPLTHMVRNAIDHGLESPEVRAAAGKPEEGLVHLSALHRSGRIVIEVSDDGAGIDRARVKELAASKGLIAAEAALSDEEIDNLIFLPGFSTVSAVSDISGRGVGMDVVRRSVQALGGRISIRSRPRHGSTFTMSLPLALAVLDGMVVTVAGETLVVPLTAIVETLQPKSAEVHGFGGNARVIAIRDQFIPLIDVGRELDYRAGYADSRTGVALLVESGGHARSALLVDAILGQRQVVIKSLEANYRHVQGIAAATILGDGRIALILDVDAVEARSREAAAGFEQLRAAAG